LLTAWSHSLIFHLPTAIWFSQTPPDPWCCCNGSGMSTFHSLKETWGSYYEGRPQESFRLPGLGFLRLVLHKIGIQAPAIEWIMTCVTNVQFVVIINGYLTTYFKAGRGLRQGCSLSPLLFILALDGLSLHISDVVASGHFLPLKIGRNIRISHSFFVTTCLSWSSSTSSHGSTYFNFLIDLEMLLASKWTKENWLLYMHRGFLRLLIILLICLVLLLNVFLLVQNTLVFI